MHIYVRPVIALAMGLHALCAHAIVKGFDPTTTPVIAPTNGQPTEVWKLVGKVINAAGGVASAVQVAPQWILGAEHVNDVGETFTNVYGTSTLQWCEFKPGTDISICRLATPIAVPGPSPFPPLVALPQTIIGSLVPYGQAMRDFGAVLGIGFSGGSARAAWVAFDGLPYKSSFAIGSETANKVLAEVPNRIYVTYGDPQNSIPYTAGGDSGGGVFWFSPSGKPALIGTFSHQNHIIQSPSLYSPDVVAWIQATLQGQGGAPFATRSFVDQAEGAEFAAPRLTVMPNTTASSTTHTRVTWNAPAALGLDSRPITDYVVTLAAGGQVERTTVVSSFARAIEWNNLALATKYIVCVTPGNATGEGTGAHGLFLSATRGTVVQTTSCNAFVSGTPPYIGSYRTRWTPNPDSTRNLTLGWTPPVFNSITKFKVVLRVVEADGTATTTLRYPTATEITLPSLPSNKRICYSVFSISSAGVVADTAAEMCADPV